MEYERLRRSSDIVDWASAQGSGPTKPTTGSWVERPIRPVFGPIWVCPGWNEMSPVDLWRSTSCLPGAPAQALSALTNGNLAQFTELVDSDLVDLDASYPEEGHTTLLQTAVHLGIHQAVVHLLDRGAKPDRYNTLLKLAPIHVALAEESRASKETIELLIRSLSENSLDARDWAGQTPLHLAAKRGDQGLSVLMLLVDKGANVGAIDSRAGHTALDMAAMVDCWRAVERLASAGALASPETLKVLEAKRPQSVKSLGLREALEKPRNSDADLVEALFRDLPSCPGVSPTQTWCDLVSSAGPNTLETLVGGQSLVQVASERGLADHLALLLQAGAAPNVVDENQHSGSSPLMLAAEAGRPEVLTLLLHHPDVRLEDVDVATRKNVLLEIMSKPLQGLDLTYQPDFSACLEDILELLEGWKRKEKRRAILNLQV